MSINAKHIVGILVAMALMVAGPLPTLAVPAPSQAHQQPVSGWSAMADTDTATLLRQVRNLPLADLAGPDQPYCAAQAEISFTLAHDFDESRIEVDPHAGTVLWGSDSLGTWTMVAPRGDGTSCIIASGIGFDPDRDPARYFASVGLNHAPR